MKKRIFYLCLLCSTLLFPLLGQTQVPKGDRILAWQVDMAENNNYDSAFAYAQNACMESIHLFFRWSAMETDTALAYDSTFIADYLSVVNIYYPAHSTQAELQIAVVNTVRKETPPQLSALSFDDPIVINRFKRLLDSVFFHIPNLELAALNIGNESDVFFGSDSSQYLAFKTFLDSVAPYAQQLYFNLHGTNLKVGTTFTLKGLTTSPTDSLCQIVNAGRDIVSTTYYPLNNDFTMQGPNVVAGDFAALVSQYPDTNQPIYFAECGYASSPTCISHEYQQMVFYQQVFRTWDTYADNIKYLTIFKTTDWSQAVVDDLALYYGISDTIFLEYLRTLGLRTWSNDGTTKVAYKGIICLLQERFWCSVNCTFSGLESEPKAAKARIYPNPMGESSILQFPNPNQEPFAVSIYDSQGKVVRLFPEITADRVAIYREGLPNGMYFYQVNGDNALSFSGLFLLQ